MLKLQYSVYINLNARFEWVKIHTKDLEQVKQTQHVPNVHIYIIIVFFVNTLSIFNLHS